MNQKSDSNGEFSKGGWQGTPRNVDSNGRKCESKDSNGDSNKVKEPENGSVLFKKNKSFKSSRTNSELDIADNSADIGYMSDLFNVKLTPRPDMGGKLPHYLITKQYTNAD